MSVLLFVEPKCTLAASHAAPWWVTVSMPTGQTDDQRTDARPLRRYGALFSRSDQCSNQRQLVCRCTSSDLKSTDPFTRRRSATSARSSFLTLTSTTRSSLSTAAIRTASNWCRLYTTARSATWGSALSTGQYHSASSTCLCSSTGCLAPAPLKLRPNGAIQICLLLDRPFCERSILCFAHVSFFFQTHFFRRLQTDIFETFPHDVALLEKEALLCLFPKSAP